MEENERKEAEEIREKSKWTFFRKKASTVDDVELGLANQKPEKIEEAAIPEPIKLPKKKKKPTVATVVDVDTGAITSARQHPDYLAPEADNETSVATEEASPSKPKRPRKKRAPKPSEGEETVLVEQHMEGGSAVQTPMATPRVIPTAELVQLDTAADEQSRPKKKKKRVPKKTAAAAEEDPVDSGKFLQILNHNCE
jgi:hypothetical protein